MVKALESHMVDSGSSLRPGSFLFLFFSLSHQIEEEGERGKRRKKKFLKINKSF